MKISKLKICESNAGFYLGRHYLEDDMEGDPNDGGMPYSRSTEYLTYEEAVKWLAMIENYGADTAPQYDSSKPNTELP